MDALSVERIALFELVEDADLDLACVAVLWNGADDLDCHPRVRLRVDGLDDLAKGALSEQLDCAVCETRERLRTRTE